MLCIRALRLQLFSVQLYLYQLLRGFIFCSQLIAHFIEVSLGINLSANPGITPEDEVKVHLVWFILGTVYVSDNPDITPEDEVKVRFSEVYSRYT